MKLLNFSRLCLLGYLQVRIHFHNTYVLLDFIIRLYRLLLNLLFFVGVSEWVVDFHDKTTFVSYSIIDVNLSSGDECYFNRCMNVQFYELSVWCFNSIELNYETKRNKSISLFFECMNAFVHSLRMFRYVWMRILATVTKVLFY